MLLIRVLALILMVAKIADLDSLVGDFDSVGQVTCNKSISQDEYRNGRAHADISECALMCLMYDDCAFIQWDYPDNDWDPCDLALNCNGFSDHETCDTYTRRANASSWLDVPQISSMPGMLAFNLKESSGHDIGRMKNMAEDVCALHCLLTECVLVVWYLVSGECWFKFSGAGNILQDSYPDSNVHLKAVIASCMPGFGCYALLSFQNGQTKAMAKKHCQDAGAHLVEFESQDELDSVSSNELFAMLRAPLWLGVSYKDGQWHGEKSGSVVTVLPWGAGPPAEVSEGTPLVVDPNNNWAISTANENDKAFPFCELTTITMTTRGQPMNYLNDGDLATCFTPQMSSEAAGTTLQTTHLNPARPSQILVKVHGDGIVCSQNVHVWQMVAGNNNGGGTHLSLCQLSGSYIWQQMQLCLFSCDCDDTHMCSAAYLRMDYTTGFSVCEFAIL